MSKQSPIQEHIERCIELYAGTIDVNFDEAVDRPGFEQMRSDLLIAVGMLTALASLQTQERDDA